MAGVPKFRVGIEDPAVYINIDAPQIMLLTTFFRAREGYTVVRKLSRSEIVNVGKQGKKTIEQLCSQLFSDTTPLPLACTTPSTSKADSGNAVVVIKKLSRAKPERQSSFVNHRRSHEHLARPCPHCGCRRVRVMNTGRTDGRNIMECTKSDCLATIMFTDIPAGTLINPGGKPEEFSWYDLDPGEIFYPTSITLKRLEEGLKHATKNQRPPKICYDEHGCIVIRCPGQAQRVRLL